MKFGVNKQGQTTPKGVEYEVSGKYSTPFGVVYAFFSTPSFTRCYSYSTLFRVGRPFVTQLFLTYTHHTIFYSNNEFPDYKISKK
jgi:hypothetical protein